MRADAHYVDELDTPAIVKVQMIRVHAIDGGDDASATALSSLIESIRRHGVIEPLIVQKRERRYRLIAGMKRLAAARHANLQEVPCLVKCVDDNEASTIAAAMKTSAPPIPKEPTAAPRPTRAPNLRLLDDAIAASLDAVVSSMSLLAESSSQLARTVARDLIRAEAGRARELLEAARTLRYGVGADQRHVAPIALVRVLTETIESETHVAR